jgi:general secretion pathway protein G
LYTKNGFTMIELVFVIVVLGILAAIAIPRLAATRDDAQIAKGRANILAIRSGIISERQARMFRGDSTYIATLGGADPLFGNVLTQSVAAKGATVDGGWRKGAGETYIFRVMGADITFTYNQADGTFDCVGGAGTTCSLLTD